MSKTELISAMAEKAGITKKQAAAAFDAAVETIISEVAAGQKVALAGFGTFEARQRAARHGINPQTHEPMEIPATTVPAFKAARGFRDALHGEAR